jgi:hypothetical protein
MADPQSFVIRLTAGSGTSLYAGLWDGPAMPVSEFRLNRFERILFRLAIVLASVIVAVRVGAIAVLWFLHH